MGTLALVAHPDHPPLAVSSVEAAVIGLTEHWLRLRWRVEDAAAVLLPRFAGKGRTDGLWQETCFEVFLRTPGTDGYVELNLSPSERWSAYDFTGYRAGMVDRPLPRDPDCTVRVGRNMLIFDGSVPLGTADCGLPPLPWKMGLSAVIEEQGEDGETVKSLWALRHPPGPADFHSPACFAAKLGPPHAP